MIKKLYELGYFDYRGFILDNLKSLSLSTTEAIILIKILDDFKKSPSFNPESLRNKMNIRKDAFESALANLLERKIYEIYLSYDNNIGFEAISLDGFFSLVSDIISDNKKYDENEIHSIIMYVNKEFNRVLSSNELEIIKSLIEEDRYVMNDFVNAITNLKDSNKLLNIKNLSNELAKKSNNSKVKKETPECVKNFIKNIK